jgi:hypothetical protein
VSEPCDGCPADATHFLCDTCASEDIEAVVKERDEALKQLAALKAEYAEARFEFLLAKKRIAEKQREACAVFMQGPDDLATRMDKANADCVRSTPLVTEEKP